MRLVLIPPYQNPVLNWGFVLRELVSNMEKRGQTDGIEIDIDEGYFIESTSEKRDEEVLALITVGGIRKIREYSEMGKYDAIVLTAGIDPAFVAGRLVSKIPVAAAIHSGLHVASLIGERCTIIQSFVPTGLIIRHLAERYGLSHKLASVRCCGHSTFSMYRIINKYREKKEERASDPELRKVIDDIVNQCIAAIEKDRVDSLILGNEPLPIFENEIRQGLDEAGYDEVPIICAIPAAVEMAKVMASMKLMQAPRAYPSASLKAKPEYW